MGFLKEIAGFDPGHALCPLSSVDFGVLLCVMASHPAGSAHPAGLLMWTQEMTLANGFWRNVAVQVIRLVTEGLAKDRTKGQSATQPCQSGCLKLQNTAKSKCVQRSI